MTKRLLKAAQRMELRDLLDMSASLQAISHQMDDHRANAILRHVDQAQRYSQLQ